MEVITTHLNADFDAMGSMIAAKKLYPDAVLVFSGSQEKSLRRFFLESVFYMAPFEKARKIDLEKVKRLILVDIRQRDRIGKFEQILDRSDVEVHIYDHHPPTENDVRGDVEFISRRVNAQHTQDRTAQQRPSTEIHRCPPLMTAESPPINVGIHGFPK